MKPSVLVFSGYGLNCEEETKYAFEAAGGKSEIIHINDIIAKPSILKDFQIAAFPGGFSFGDDTGSGNAFANKVRNNIWDELLRFLQRDTLTIGICNGFQILVNLGLLPALKSKYGERQVALLHNNNARYTDRWVDLKITSKTPWFKDIKTISVPIAHGEGKFYADEKTMKEIKDKKLVAAKYVSGEICRIQNLPANPNGSLEGIAAIHDETGRVLGMMPHPERAIQFTQLPHWTLLKEEYLRKGKSLPNEGPGIKIFENAVNYFSKT